MNPSVDENESELEREVRNAIRAARQRGATTFYEMLEACEGADPRLVARLLGTPTRNDVAPAAARRETSELAALFPAADPVGCQWWFTLDTIETLANRVFQSASPGGRVAFLGAPTVAFQYSRRTTAGAVAFELDRHVLEAISSVAGLDGVQYDVADALPSEHREAYSVVLVDPPWYQDVMRAFLFRALEMASDGASVLCSIPPRLTRPGIVEERQALLKELLDAQVEIVGIERSATRYLVPAFERRALTTLSEFDGRPWRSGDMLHVRRKERVTLAPVTLEPAVSEAFARSPKHYRVFLRKNFRLSSRFSGLIRAAA